MAIQPPNKASETHYITPHKQPILLAPPRLTNCRGAAAALDFLGGMVWDPCLAWRKRMRHPQIEALSEPGVAPPVARRRRTASHAGAAL